MSSDVHLLTDLIASAQAADHCKYFAALPSEIKGMFLIRARRGLGLTAHRGWARLLIGRMDTKVQRPEFPQAPELELEIVQSQMAQKPMLRGELGARAWRV